MIRSWTKDGNSNRDVLHSILYYDGDDVVSYSKELADADDLFLIRGWSVGCRHVNCGRWWGSTAGASSGRRRWWCHAPVADEGFFVQIKEYVQMLIAVAINHLFVVRQTDDNTEWEKVEISGWIMN